MVVLASGAAAPSSSVRGYLDEHDVLPTLEAGFEEMLRACSGSEKKDPINFLASWLMRHNPKHNPDFAKKLQERVAAEAAKAAAEAAKAAAAKTTASAEGSALTMDVSDGGKVSLGF